MKTECEINSHCHVPAERAELFSCHDGGSTELEYLELLRALVRTIKPASILETGCYRGHGTLALAGAVKANGFGRVYSVDTDASAIETARALLTENSVGDVVHFEHANAFDFIPRATEAFDLAFFDSHLPSRADECRTCIEHQKMLAGSVAVFHDSSKLRHWDGRPDPHTAAFWKSFEELRPLLSDVFEFKLSRGLLMVRIG